LRKIFYVSIFGLFPYRLIDNKNASKFIVEIKLIIDHTNDGYYSVTTLEYDSLPFLAFGEGNTIEDAKTDFMNMLKGMAAMEDNYDITELTFSYCYSLPAFLAFYKDRLSLAGLERITGVSQRQLSHYLTGHRNPNSHTVTKIRTALTDFVRELSDVDIR
jgi:hypothetical protein